MGMKKEWPLGLALLLCVALSALASPAAETPRSAAVVVSATGRAEQYNVADYEKLTGQSLPGFNESPVLAARVAAGTLPPVQDRLPVDVAVVTPVEEIGQYGGTAQAMSLGMVGIGEGYSLMGSEGLFGVLGEDLQTIVPNVAKSFDFSADGKTLVVELRRGMRWSDGHPFTADDLMFWYEDMLLNPELTRSIRYTWAPGGETMVWTKLDDYTVRMTFAAPHPHILSYMSLLDGQVYAPAHYLKQFHAKYADKDALEKLVKERGFDNWVQLFRDDGSRARLRESHTNMERPTLAAFIPKEIGTTASLYERNPYYWKVDPAGNQLPYIDQLQVTRVDNTEVMNARMLAGQADFFAENSDFSNYSLYMESAQRSGYRVILWDQDAATDGAFFPNYTAGDAVIRELNQDKRFRIALSLAIDRDAINRVLFFGRGTIAQPTALPGAPWYDASLRNAYTKQDVAEANRLLDEMGLRWDARREWRLRRDGGTLEYVLINGPVSLPNKIAEMVIEDWKAIGIKVNFKVQDWGITHPLHQSGGSDMFVFMVDKSDAYGLTSGGDGLSWYAFTNGVRYFSSPMLPSATSTAPWPAEFSRNAYPFNEMIRLQNLALELNATVDAGRRTAILRDIFRSYSENVFVIGTVVGPKPVLASNRLRNLTAAGVWGDGLKQMTAFHPEQLFIRQ